MQVWGAGNVFTAARLARKICARGRRMTSEWPVVEIRGADHVSCIVMPQFREEIAALLKKNENSGPR